MKNFNFEDYNQRFGGIARLYGSHGLAQLLNATVMIVGLGGVGSWSVEALARSGVGHLILVDLDEVCITNTNRQICATNNDIGKNKAIVLKERVLAINPQCKVVIVESFYTKNTSEEILSIPTNYVIDAIDSFENKCLLVATCMQKDIPIITTGGAAGKSDPTQIKIDDLGLTINDTLLQMMRKRLRREYGFTKLSGPSSLSKRKKIGLMAVFSPEDPVYPASNGEICKVPENRENVTLDCESGMGSVTHITGIFGFMAASFVIKQIAYQQIKN